MTIQPASGYITEHGQFFVSRDDAIEQDCRDLLMEALDEKVANENTKENFLVLCMNFAPQVFNYTQAFIMRKNTEAKLKDEHAVERTNTEFDMDAAPAAPPRRTVKHAGTDPLKMRAIRAQNMADPEITDEELAIAALTSR